MPDFKAIMHQVQFWLGHSPLTHWGSSEHSSSWI